LDPDLAVFDVHSMSERIDLSLSSRRTSMLLANAFGGVALFLASLGIYGVLAYLVARRTREIGIRVALGSTRAGVLKLVLREGFQLVAIGLVLGIIGAASFAKKAVASEIYGVRSLDPLVLASVMALLAIVALAACAVPSPSRHARRPHGCAEIRIILSANHYTTKADGGKGAARELVELILSPKASGQKLTTKPRLKAGLFPILFSLQYVHFQGQCSIPSAPFCVKNCGL